MSKRKRRRKKHGFTPSITEQANGRKRGLPGMGIGPHQETSPMARATRTPNKRDLQRKRDQKRKQQGWD
jgi:hypothetical protein